MGGHFAGLGVLLLSAAARAQTAEASGPSVAERQGSVAGGESAATATAATGASQGEAGASQAAPQDARRVDIREADANVDRVVLMSTAETQPKGRLFFSAHELVFWQLGYAFTDRVQATVTTWPVLVKDQPFFLDGALKANLLRTDTVRVAAIAGATYVSAEVEDAHDTASAGRLALAGQLCLTESCWTSVVGNLSGWIPLSHSGSTLFLGGLGLTSKVSQHVGLLFELTSGAIYDDGLDFANGMLINYGVRFSGSAVGVDLTMLRPTGEDTGDIVMGIPFVSFTYRSDPLTP